MSNFMKECEEWLNPLGYSTHSYNGEGTEITFVNVESLHHPTIVCMSDENGTKSCKLVGGNSLKYFIQMTTGEMQFKHPSIQDYINAFRYYDELISLNNLW